MGYFDLSEMRREEIRVGKTEFLRHAVKQTAERGVRVTILTSPSERLMTEIEMNHPNVTVASFPKER